LIYYRVLFRRVNHRQNATTAAHLTWLLNNNNNTPI
jgi:hypothetical protein